MELTSVSGYLGLVILSILSPSPIPIPLDLVALGSIAKGYNPVAVVTTVVLGNLIGTLVFFFLGRKSRDLVSRIKKKRKRPDYVMAENLFKKYGKFSLLFGGIPFLGDALIFLAGFYRMKIIDFAPFFILGKVLWYSILATGIVKLI